MMNIAYQRDREPIERFDCNRNLNITIITAIFRKRPERFNNNPNLTENKFIHGG
ncbi:5451_t:CDS:2 [Diversispora eburnea]|uniref:5451_t:CDS:1 n=1 Tax=Diversispora eburnea TaxID=1213867 RepID=A0A9N9CH72_9GLOM|nr:5451_t:CDS:2 [Diversispora eburnea]